MSKTPEKFTFFFRPESVYSQWHSKDFKGVPLFESEGIEHESLKFKHCEQWMMYNKALLFGDAVTARLIITCDDPKQCKAYGRAVQNFDQNKWTEHNEEIIYEGNKLKFTQNPELLQALMDTEGTTLVEASPFDCLYGIGLSATNPKALSRSTWRGKNLLGKTLTRLRNDLKKQTLERDSN